MGSRRHTRSDSEGPVTNGFAGEGLTANSKRGKIPFDQPVSLILADHLHLTLPVAQYPQKEYSSRLNLSTNVYRYAYSTGMDKPCW